MSGLTSLSRVFYQNPAEAWWYVLLLPPRLSLITTQLYADGDDMLGGQAAACLAPRAKQNVNQPQPACVLEAAARVAS